MLICWIQVRNEIWRKVIAFYNMEAVASTYASIYEMCLYIGI